MDLNFVNEIVAGNGGVLSLIGLAITVILIGFIKSEKATELVTAIVDKFSSKSKEENIDRVSIMKIKEDAILNLALIHI